MGQMKGKFSKAQDMMGGGGDEGGDGGAGAAAPAAAAAAGGGGGMMDKIFRAENAPDLALGFKADSTSSSTAAPSSCRSPRAPRRHGLPHAARRLRRRVGRRLVRRPGEDRRDEAVPGIGYLGMGYDVYHGNPEGDEKLMSDPFRLPIRQLSYTGVSMTRDNKYLTPDGSMSIRSACARSEIARDVSTQARYSNSLSEDRQVTLKSPTQTARAPAASASRDR